MKQWRIVILGNIIDYYSYFTYGMLEGAIRNGAWAKTVQLIGRSVKDIRDELVWFKPHFIIAHMIFGPLRNDVLSMLHDLRRKMGTKVVYHMGDARMTPRYPHPINEWVDLGLVNHGMFDHFSAIWRIPCIHFPYMCFYQKDIADFDHRYASAIAFTGDFDSSTHHGPRKAFVNNLKRLIKIKTYPTPETGNTRFQTAELAASSDAVLGMQMGTDIPLYQDVRPFQYIGAGAVYFHDECEGIDTFFMPGKHYIPYERDNAKHLIEQYNKYVISKPDRGYSIRRAGFEFCQKYHSTKERVASIIRYFEGADPLPLYKNQIL